mmetsp:Transcript_19804/g.24017  ORF Transcript_19804/g.24017 Transcript_19804/m.24017 type:complete len:179 (-) Transcript_19804:1006-1542(-)
MQSKLGSGFANHDLAELEDQVKEIIELQNALENSFVAQKGNLDELLKDKKQVLQFFYEMLPYYKEKTMKIKQDMAETSRKTAEMQSRAFRLMQSAQDRALEEEQRREMEQVRDKYLLVQAAKIDVQVNTEKYSDANNINVAPSHSSSQPDFETNNSNPKLVRVKKKKKKKSKVAEMDG